MSEQNPQYQAIHNAHGDLLVESGQALPEGGHTPPPVKTKKPIYKRWWAITIAVIFVLIGAGQAMGGASKSASGSAEGSKPAASAPANQGSKADEPTAAEKVVTVKASTILKEFQNNELAADAKYKGKTLKITGVVSKVDTELFDGDKYYVQINGGGQFEFLNVNCHGMSQDDLSTLSKGDKVTVIGTFDDGGDLGVEISDSALA